MGKGPRAAAVVQLSAGRASPSPVEMQAGCGGRTKASGSGNVSSGALMKGPRASHSGRRCRRWAAAVASILSVLAPRIASAQVAATVRGVVRDADSDAPVAAALLSLEGRQALSSTDGTFRFQGIPAGTYRLHVEAAGY